MTSQSTAPAGRRVAAPAGPERDAAFTEALDVLVERRDEFARQGHVPKDYIALLKRAGMFRASTPARFGGEPMAPSDFMRLVERVSAVDPATGWVASFGSALQYFSALPTSSQERIYADGPDIAFAAGMFPMQKAETVEGGFRVSGVWQFASGCKGADILGVGLAGGPETKGRPLTALVSPEEVEIVDNWDVAGMRGTGSHAIRADGVFVPADMTFIRGGEPTIDEPLTRYPAVAYAAQVLAVVALGAARGALDYAHAVGAAKASITGGGGRGMRPSYQAGLGHAEAELRSARAFFYEGTDEVWDRVVRGDVVRDEDRVLLRLGATHAAHVGRRAILDVFDLAGTGAIYESHPLQRYLQDGIIPAQHAMLQSGTYEASGAVLLGLEPAVPSFP
ncbi:flavin-dependent monooxygenase [Tsukamurella sp. 8F]|uniref:acyl-CoA dehydrogenase family protein n=1 Tax=unclassified Tsukamurella TaxID=2633480 RepID=UPI0023B8F3A2|nr:MULTISPECIES: acyl-CoA dehydrogenase family protein [unclassified Tsukamurella]MDF0529268.1 flavin-dependent monooxygenase [Tsukamurella sp. 8J]MDF0586895.1 flavin-dependent monooxygenase [Tsukamurella sp. 8F]